MADHAGRALQGERGGGLEISDWHSPWKPLTWLHPPHLHLLLPPLVLHHTSQNKHVLRVLYTHQLHWARQLNLTHESINTSFLLLQGDVICLKVFICCIKVFRQCRKRRNYRIRDLRKSLIWRRCYMLVVFLMQQTRGCEIDWIQISYLESRLIYDLSLYSKHKAQK